MASTTTKAVSLVLIVVGAGLLFWGYDMSESAGAQLTEAVTGSHSDEVMMRLIGGAASLVVGLFLFFKR
ncbi:DUF3185 family protein [Bowmanella dokdonensis]|uniref:DUF3185 family protein n=1 Tax=Bowmanella dokdonensis TaxID=751969 RepID=A0A939DRW7_9ALTE|nr:DUF3185 family protein [Bowmanella dokdonensis]MBN7827232.1 DUF3185 family protein [Bowmanella dokdonensis]